MSKNLILQVSIAKKGNEGKGFLKYDKNIYDHSVEAVSKYAKRIGADHFVIRDESYLVGEYHPMWHRFALFTDTFKDYDNIVYVDCDFFFHRWTPDIFEMMDSCEEWIFASIDTSGGIPNKFKFRDRFNGRYFNSGLFCIKREAINAIGDKWKHYLEEYQGYQFPDQDALNSLVADNFDDPTNRKFKLLSKHWNGTFSGLNWYFSSHYAAIDKMDWKWEKHLKKITKKERICETLSDSEKRELYFYYPSNLVTTELF